MKNDYPNGQPAALPRSAKEPPALSESLQRFSNRSPSESLGLPTGNNLGKPFFQATIIAAVLLALLTVGPYWWAEKPQESGPKEAPPAAKPEPAEPVKTPSPSPDATANSVPPLSTQPPAGKGDIVNKLGENVTKTAPATVNPLDKKDDDILKDIK